MAARSKPTPIRTPAHVDVFVSVLGIENAIEFLLEFGGADLYISQGNRNGSRLVKAIGPQKTYELWLQRDRIPRRIPVARVWIAQTWISRGMSVAEVARRLRVSDVTIRKYKRAMPALPDERKGRASLQRPSQLDLFND